MISPSLIKKSFKTSMWVGLTVLAVVTMSGYRASVKDCGSTGFGISKSDVIQYSLGNCQPGATNLSTPAADLPQTFRPAISTSTPARSVRPAQARDRLVDDVMHQLTSDEDLSNWEILPQQKNRHWRGHKHVVSPRQLSDMVMAH